LRPIKRRRGMNENWSSRVISAVSRRRLIVGGLSLAASLVAITACSRGRSGTIAVGTSDPFATTIPSTQPTTEPTVARSISALKIHTRGGLSPWQYEVRNVPEYTVVDNTAIYLGPMPEVYPGPALPNLLSRTLDADASAAITKVLTDARFNGAEIDYGLPGVTDMPGTKIEFTLDGKTFTQYAYALSFVDADRDLTVDQKAARKTMREVITRLTDLDSLAPGHMGAEQQAKATTFEIWGSKYVAPKKSTESDQPITDWPHPTIDLTPVAFELPRCIAADASVEATFAKANTSSVFRQGDLLVELIPRPMLPGETACKRNG
jgi:hypothetical protein